MGSILVDKRVEEPLSRPSPSRVGGSLGRTWWLEKGLQRCTGRCGLLALVACCQARRNLILSATRVESIRFWIPQASMIPFVMLCRELSVVAHANWVAQAHIPGAQGTASTSALWCTPEGIVVSLGPIPLCLFRKRIPYRRRAMALEFACACNGWTCTS